MTYPQVLSENDTIELALAGESLSRFGDGELRLCVGGQARSQEANKKLRIELCDILAGKSKALPCIPNVKNTVKNVSWARYCTPDYVRLYKLPAYGSAFISRPDSAPWINTQSYWYKVRSLWRGKSVTLVWEDKPGPDLSLTPKMMSEATEIRQVRAPALNAYSEIDAIERAIGRPDGPVIMCLGATATVLAARLAGNGIHALDLGHVGTFMRKAMAA